MLRAADKQTQHELRHVPYSTIATKCEDLKTELAARGIRYHPNSILGKVLRAAEERLHSDLKGDENARLVTEIYVSYAQRIAHACLAARSDAGAKECIRRVIAENTDLSQQTSSRGKDALWELELAEILRRKGNQVNHIDPPDLICSVSFGPYPIACKKIYSIKNIESQVRKGARQLADYGLPGIVALNLDDLVPASSILQSSSHEDASACLGDLNRDFLDRHKHKMHRFIRDGRCDGVLLATTAFVDIPSSQIRSHTITATTLWTINFDERAQVRLDEIRNILS